jgi:mono/diheme cytochrome c family protein
VRLLTLAPIAAAAALLAAGCAGNGSVGATGHIAQSSDIGLGKTLFQQKCSGCHTLADAGAKGTVGPNLDEALGMPGKQGFNESTIRDIVRGQIAYPSPPMPEDLVTGEQADAVASYVAQVAGQPVQGTGVRATPLPTTPGTTAGGPTTNGATTTSPAQTPSGSTGGANAAALADGKSVFTSAGCSGCHTLHAAGASGNVGPNLDQLKPSKARVAAQVTNGGKIMPAFKGRLSQKQIADVAAYVAKVAGT